MGFSNGNGNSSIAGGTDVALSNPAGGDALVYNSSLSKWQNTPITGSNLTTVAVQTSVYYAGPNQLIPADATNAAFTVTLPGTPADKTRVVIKKIDSSANIVTIQASGNDVFNKASGVTSVSLSLQNQAVSLQYAASLSVWYVISDDLPLSQLDGRYTLKTNNLADLVSAPVARTNLGLATVAATGSYADLTSKPTIPAVLVIGASTITAGALMINQLTPVDATAGNIVMTLPTGQAAGTVTAVRKQDTSANIISVTGNIAGVANATISLVLTAETLTFETDSAGSWWVVSGNKSIASLDARYPLKTNNLSDLASVSVARNNLGLGSAALLPSTSFASSTGPVPSVYAASNDYRFTGTAASKQITDYTLALADAGSVVEVESSTNVTITVPPSYTIPFQGGTLIELSQTGAGQITVAAGTNVTLHNAAGLKSRTQWSSLSLRKRPGGGSALPTTNLLLRHRADDLAGANGSKVASWPDTSGNNFPAATQATVANQPTLLTNAINGHKGLSFGGSTQFLSLSGSTLTLEQAVSTISVFVVYTCSTVSSGTRNLFSLSTGTSATSTRLALEHRDSAGNSLLSIKKLDTDSSTFVEGAAVVAGEAAGLAGVIDYGSGTARLYKNGTQAATATVTTGTTSNTTSLSGAIGASPDGSANLFYGTIAEVLVYGSVDATTRAGVSTYIQNTYGITMSDALSGADEWVVTGDSSV